MLNHVIGMTLVSQAPGNALQGAAVNLKDV
jgi:hypothetical protein